MKTKRIIALMSAVIMVFTCCMSAFATTDTTTPIVTKTTCTMKMSDGTKKTLKATCKGEALKAKTKAAKKINAFFEDLEYKELKSLKSDVAEMEASIKHTCTHKLTYNGNGIYSFVATEDEEVDMATHGSHTITGYNFSAKTGKKISNTKLTGLSASALKNKIVAATAEVVNKDKESFFSDAMKTVNKMKANKFNCYRSGDSLYVVYNQYEIAPYSTGAVTVKIAL